MEAVYVVNVFIQRTLLHWHFRAIQLRNQVWQRSLVSLPIPNLPAHCCRAGYDWKLPIVILGKGNVGLANLVLVRLAKGDLLPPF